MADVKSEMEAIKGKKNPSRFEVLKYVRYMINVEKAEPESIHNLVSSWRTEEVDKAIKEVEQENAKPRPKRYYVSLKEPLEE